MAQERKNGFLENVNISRCLQTSAECLETKSPLGIDDI
jgi:hypothetical protein